MGEEPSQRAMGPISNEEEAEGARANRERLRAIPEEERSEQLTNLLAEEEARIATWEEAQAAPATPDPPTAAEEVDGVKEEDGA